MSICRSWTLEQIAFHLPETNMKLDFEYNELILLNLWVFSILCHVLFFFQIFKKYTRNWSFSKNDRIKILLSCQEFFSQQSRLIIIFSVFAFPISQSNNLHSYFDWGYPKHHEQGISSECSFRIETRSWILKFARISDDFSWTGWAIAVEVFSVQEIWWNLVFIISSESTSYTKKDIVTW